MPPLTSPRAVARCALLVAAWIPCVSCGSPPAGRPQGPHAPRKVTILETWPVLRDGEEVGAIQWVDIEDRVSTIRFYRVENEFGQLLGMIDRQGRVYRNVPFAHEEEFCGMYPMREGLALLFEADDAARFDVVGGVPAVEAAARRRGADDSDR